MLILILVNGNHLTLWNNKMINTPESPKKNLYSITYTLGKKDIMTFVSGLHEIQMDMIEVAVEKSGYKDAAEVIKYIMEKK